MISVVLEKTELGIRENKLLNSRFSEFSHHQDSDVKKKFMKLLPESSSRGVWFSLGILTEKTELLLSEKKTSSNDESSQSN